MPTPPGQESVSAPVAATDVTRQELPYRLRQQSLLGEFGRSALQTRDIEHILQRATELCAQGLETPLAKVLEGGTWAAGRRIAAEKRSDGRPPINVISDGTVF